MSAKKTGLLFATICLFSGSAMAEYLGLPSGRSANPGSYPDITVEAGLVTGDLGLVDYQNIGARVNYRLSNEMVLYGDFGVSELGDADGNPFGLGLLYFLSNQRIAPNLDMAAKLSFHTASYEIANFDVDFSVIAFEALVSSPTPISDNGLSWYGNFGVHRLSSDPGDDDFELAIGGGVYLPVGPGEVWLGGDLVDEFTFGLGYRYFLQ